METVTRKRIEIVADAALVPRIAAVCATAGVKGHSIVHLDGGAGRSGAWRADGLTAAEAKVMIMVVASADIAARLVDVLAPVLDSHGLLLTVGDVEVVRAERFG
jgi:hypothetical protein